MSFFRVRVKSNGIWRIQVSLNIQSKRYWNLIRYSKSAFSPFFFLLFFLDSVLLSLKRHSDKAHQKSLSLRCYTQIPANATPPHPPLFFIASLRLITYFLLSEKLLCRPHCPWTHKDLPVSATKVLGLKVCTILLILSSSTLLLT